MPRIRVLIVDDSAFLRSAIRSVLRGAGDIEIVGVAGNGREAIDQARSLQPDVVTLDLEMPELDGLTALRVIRSVCRAKVILVSSYTTEGTRETLEALRAGADDFIPKDTGARLSGLAERIRALAGVPRPATTPPVRHVSFRGPVRLQPAHFDLIVIGASTGGPAALETILTALPSPFPLPIVIAQHMPGLFTKSMADRLARTCRIPVHHVDRHLELARGHIYLAEGGRHIKVRRGLGRQLTVETDDTPSDAQYRPSVDELFTTTAEAVGARALGIVLTGMGQDGLVGARSLRCAGATMIAQRAESCVVYGMPKAVVEAGLTLAALSPPEIATTLSLLALAGHGAEGEARWRNAA